VDDEADINPAFKKPEQQQFVRGTLLSSPDTHAELLLEEIRGALLLGKIRLAANERATLETIITSGICTVEDADFIIRLHDRYDITGFYWC
jgi:hypothetical protein